ncbi:hypothetical protein ACO0R3_001676 [Hanseniaspora guilliermondii]
MFVRKEYAIDDNTLNTTTIFEDGKKKYLKDPFNNLIKNELKYHHNIRIYNQTQFNPFKIINLETDMKDKIQYSKGILKDTIICTRPIPSNTSDYDYIKFNMKIFGINLNNLEDNLKADLLMDEDISMENVINSTINFEVKRCTLFQNTNLLFVEVCHNELKYLLIYDLLSKVLMKDENNQVVKLEHQKVIFFETDTKRRIFGVIHNNIIKKYRLKSYQQNHTFLKDLCIHVQIPNSKNIYNKDDMYVCVNESDMNEMIIFESDLATPIRMYSLKPEKNKIYNVAISNDKSMMVTTSRNGTSIKLFKKTNTSYALFMIYKRGMNSALNYVIGFSNDDALIFSLSYNRTLHLYGVEDVNKSLHVIKLSSRIVDDFCDIKIMSDTKSNVYFIYVLWKYNGIIEMYKFDMKLLTSKKISYVEMY